MVLQHVKDVTLAMKCMQSWSGNKFATNPFEMQTMFEH